MVWISIDAPFLERSSCFNHINQKELFACSMKLHNLNFVTTARENIEEPDSFFAAK